MGCSRDRRGGDDRLREVRRILWGILVLNLAVAGAKLVYGLVTRSLAMTADGFHSLFDGTSNVIGLVGVSIAARPADRGHPYGHAKYETYASAAIGVLLTVAAWRVGAESIQRLLAGGGTPRVDAGSFGVMLATLAVNVAVTTWERRAGIRLKSDILIADASHTGSDILVSLGVIAGLAAVKAGYPIADPVLGLVVCAFIVRAALRVFRSVDETLSDRARLDPKTVEAVALEVPGVLGCHDVRTRGTASHVAVDLHVQVDPEVSIAAGHEIAETVERVLCERFDVVSDVIAHVEPLDDYQKAKSARWSEQA
ncbi:cation diffusion facilitator family transporter [Coriobacteriia bacterium Es71-Z0120]|uniref:cation diffusion facilitator family transporter n=1 Tax=Parvivirga hydrogeniphila TaxID=2939460 RepID=UPI002261015D|nr:cation diffusion facilitator family transporter [Parvivirga hydrogeniphila]MCL4078897.1 cation diffusion facilitator family transporter [Parvivirga hydrogeniphila]